jgi:hypothetical protein
MEHCILVDAGMTQEEQTIQEEALEEEAFDWEEAGRSGRTPQERTIWFATRLNLFVLNVMYHITSLLWRSWRDLQINKNINFANQTMVAFGMSLAGFLCDTVLCRRVDQWQERVH